MPRNSQLATPKSQWQARGPRGAVWAGAGGERAAQPCPVLQCPVRVLGAGRGPWRVAQAAWGLHGTWGRGCTHGLQLVPLVSPSPTLPVPRAPGRCTAPSLRNAERDTRAGVSGAAQPRSQTRPRAACPLPAHCTGRPPTWQPRVGGSVDAGWEVEACVTRRAGPAGAGGSSTQHVTSHVPGPLRGLQ